MDTEPGLTEAAALFKVLGNASRLRLVRLLQDAPRTVTALSKASGLTQPMVSQHLQRLREAGLVGGERRGRETVYRVADLHVSHVVADALAHVQEHAPAGPAAVARDPHPKEPA